MGKNMNAEPKVKRAYRLDAEDYRELLKKADKLKVSESEYVRQIIHRDIHHSNIEGEMISRICQVCTIFTKVLEQSSMEDEQRELLMKEAERLCDIKIS